MNQEFIDGIKLKEMFFSSAQLLDKNKQAVNALNVFPVPDGDTGTNIALTMMAAVKELQGVKHNSVSLVADAISKGALKGARGNSGVILSQLFRGFAKRLRDEEQISTLTFAQALQEGAKTAYKAVMKPVEGTILTVARVTAEEAVRISRKNTDFYSFFKEIIKTAKETLDKTPDLLHVLKEAGVVDSGGMGLLYIMIGASYALKEDFELEDFDDIEEALPEGRLQFDIEQDIKFLYCTEFFIKNLFPYVQEDDTEKLKEKLEKLGDSIVVVRDTDLIKVHVHTNMPGKALQYGLRFGELSGIKIDNMKEQHQHTVKMPEKKYGIISVAMGEGISSIFKDLLADYVIQGGQTMNPSIEEILEGVNTINAEEIIILPNNSNIILSARQAQQISDKKIHVIPTKSIPQGLAAMIAFNPEADSDTNISKMTMAAEQVKTGQVTYAVRDSNFNGISIKKDDIIGIADGKIITAGKDIKNVTLDLLSKMLDEDSEIVTLLYGEMYNESDAQEIVDFLEEKYPDLDVELYSGGQPLYYYIISVE